jgi:hypothetical protein
VKSRKVSCVPLVLGLVVSLLALWVGAAPVLGGGSSTTGGAWYLQWHDLTLDYFGCTAPFPNCEHCSGTMYQDCSANASGQNCTTGYIIVAIASTSTTVRPAASGSGARCDDPCKWFHHASCWMP